MGRAAAGPSAIATATARLSSTTGDGLSEASIWYRVAMRVQSVSSATRALAWHAASAACSTYGPLTSLPLSDRARASDSRPWVMSSRSHRLRSWSSSVIIAPSWPVRAGMRDAWISISATSPCTSGSSGASAASIRPSRIASSHRSARVQDSPEVAA